MINYKERMLKLIKRKKELSEEITKLKIQQQSEIDDAIKRINEEYDKKLSSKRSSIGLVSDEILFINEKIKEASRFDINVIGPILSEVICEIECEEYIYEIVNLDEIPFYIIRHVDTKYSKDDNSLIFDDKLVENESIGFYANNFYDYPSLLVDFKKFSYLKEFINSIVEYRLNKSYDIEDITLEELENLVSEFLKPENVKKLTLN